mmetsp:Transcript_15397/g.33374  ORF Transcript_15397/g.33374 Transcript_15397/m.33374 type:complete len:588 (-) Transcript_15397:1196-2959(-)
MYWWLLFIVSCLCCVSRTYSATLFTHGFETVGGGGMFILIYNQQCPCPTASYAWQSTDARSGKYGFQVNISAISSQAWHVQLSTPRIPAKPGFRYNFCLWAKSQSSSATAELGLLTDVTYQWLNGQQVQLSNTWRQYCLSGSTVQSASIVYFVFDMGYQTGKISVDDVEISDSVMPSDDDWVRQAPAMIEQHRKGNFTLKFTSKSGRAITPGSVTNLYLTLTRHDFPFGSAIAPDAVQQNMKAWYAATAASMFNAMVTEYMFKWPEYEPTQGQYRYDLINTQYVKWAQTLGMSNLRGHALEWLIEAYGYDKHWSRQQGCAKYVEFLKARIIRDVGLFKGRFQHYDVWNEPLTERKWLDRCGLWDKTFADAFKWAKQADPSALLCVNDYRLIDGENWAPMLRLVSDLKQKGAPVGCIGVQAHLSPGELGPGTMKYRMDQLATAGLPLYITEFDMLTSWNNGDPVNAMGEEQQAVEFAKYITLWFSHPAIKGIYLWGFWDGRHWIRNGGMYRADGSPKQSALVVKKLWGETWNSSLFQPTPQISSSQFKFRGFYGGYSYRFVFRSKLYQGQLSFGASKGTQQSATITVD